MITGVYQFASTNRIDDNLKIIKKAISQAAENNVRLLVFHECALTGYPPIETRIEDIIAEDVERALCEIAVLAKTYKMFVAAGTVRFENGMRFNSMVVMNDSGKVAGYYDKMALWGWDTANFTRGKKTGVFDIDGARVGFRICFDVRFPEPFRDLYRQKTDLCFVSFSDTNEVSMPARYNLIKAHLMTRAVENAMTVVSVNSTADFQTAPTAVFDCNGAVVKEVNSNAESLLIYNFIKPEDTFGVTGRRVNSDYFQQIQPSL